MCIGSSINFLGNISFLYFIVILENTNTTVNIFYLHFVFILGLSQNEFCIFEIIKSAIDRAESHDLKSRLWLFFSPFLFPPKQRGKKKGRMNCKYREFKSCLSARSYKQYMYQNNVS